MGLSTHDRVQHDLVVGDEAGRIQGLAQKAGQTLESRPHRSRHGVGLFRTRGVPLKVKRVPVAPKLNLSPKNW